MDRKIVKETQEERRRLLSSAVAWMALNLSGESPEKKEEEKETAELDCLLKNMPIDIRPEILSRLPIKSIGRFMTASKGLHDLITSRRFSSMYAKNKPGYTFFGTSSSGDFDNSCVVEVSESGDSIRTDFGEVDDPDSDRVGADLVGSCNGLVCLVERRLRIDVVVIANPVTDERRTINYSNYDRGKWEVHYRFGYSPSTNEYKILRSVVTDVTELDNEYGILTVGVDERWRKLSPNLFPTYMLHLNTPMVPSCKGTIHWLGDDGDDDDGEDDYEPCGSFILAFDIAEENTRRIPIPQTDHKYWKLLVCNDPLCLYYNDEQTDIMWKMEDDDGDRWSQFEVPCIPRERGSRSVDFIASLDCAKKSGGFLFKVEGCDVMRLYCPKSNKYTTFLIPLETDLSINDELLGIGIVPLRDVTCLPDKTRLLCEINPTFSSINEMISKPSE